MIGLKAVFLLVAMVPETNFNVYNLDLIKM